MSNGADSVRPFGSGAMNPAICALAGLLIAALSLAQGSPGYTPADNPFQNEYDFSLGKPISVRVDVQGVRLDTITVVALGEVRAGEKVKCEVEVAGSNKADKKATLTTVLLFESADGKGIERITLEPFKVKTGKAFVEKQRSSVAGDTLLAASKVYVFIQVAF